MRLHEPAKEAVHRSGSSGAQQQMCVGRCTVSEPGEHSRQAAGRVDPHDWIQLGQMLRCRSKHGTSTFISRAHRTIGRNCRFDKMDISLGDAPLCIGCHVGEPCAQAKIFPNVRPMNKPSSVHVCQPFPGVPGLMAAPLGPDSLGHHHMVPEVVHRIEKRTSATGNRVLRRTSGMRNVRIDHQPACVPLSHQSVLRCSTASR